MGIKSSKIKLRLILEKTKNLENCDAGEGFRSRLVFPVPIIIRFFKVFFKINALKRIEAMIPNLKRSQVIENVLKAGALGVTVLESMGKDTGTRPIIRESRGTKQYISDHCRFYTITAIVYDSTLEDVLSAIIDVAHTGSKEDGMIFVSSVDEAISIGTAGRVREMSEDVVSRDDLTKFAKMTNLEKKQWIINKAREVTSLV